MTFGPKNIAFEFFSTERAITAKAKTAVTGKTFVSVVAGGNAQAPHAETAVAGAYPFGVAGWDAAANDHFTAQRAGVWGVIAEAPIAAGAAVAVGTGGKAVTAAAGAVVVGYAVGSAAAGEECAIALKL